jgi:uncharacterized protein
MVARRAAHARLSSVAATTRGPTGTKFFERAGMQGSKADEGRKDDRSDVARAGFEALMGGTRRVDAQPAAGSCREAAARVADRVGARGAGQG